MVRILPLAVFLFIAVFLTWGLWLKPSEVPSPLIGKPAPAFVLQSLLDPSTQVASTDLKGQPTLVNVWATWCPECYGEHEVLMQIAATGRVAVYGLNYKDQRPEALQFLRQLGNPYEAVAFDPEGVAGLDWGVYGAPETFLLDPDGIIVYKRIGALTPQVWQEEILPRIEAMDRGTQG